MVELKRFVSSTFDRFGWGLGSLGAKGSRRPEGNLILHHRREFRLRAMLAVAGAIGLLGSAAASPAEPPGKRPLDAGVPGALFNAPAFSFPAPPAPDLSATLHNPRAPWQTDAASGSTDSSVVSATVADQRVTGFVAA